MTLMTSNKDTKKKKKKTYAQLKKELDNVFSLYIRIRYSKDGLVSCFTCGVIKPIKQMQCGHYVSRSNLSLRWSEYNCHVQCFSCNIWKKGNMDVYAIKLITKYGKDILQNLMTEKHQIVKFSTVELEKMIFFFKERMKNEGGLIPNN